MIMVLIIFLSSCKELNDYTELEETLVVEAMITSDPLPQNIILSKTCNYSSDSIAFVSHANVTLSGPDSVLYSFTENEANKGIYTNSSLIGLVPGSVYRLDIHLDDPINGISDYYAESKVFPVTSIDSIRLKFHSNWGEAGAYEIKCYCQDPPTKDNYMCNLYINQRLVTYSLQDKLVMDDVLFNGNYANGVMVGILDQSDSSEVIRTGDYVVLQLGTVDDNFARFIQEVKAEISYDNPFFGSPAANTYSNLSDGAIGYFCCSMVTYSWTSSFSVRE
jgi:hypothetical protein